MTNTDRPYNSLITASHDLQDCGSFRNLIPFANFLACLDWGIPMTSDELYIIIALAR